MRRSRSAFKHCVDWISVQQCMYVYVMLQPQVAPARSVLCSDEERKQRNKYARHSALPSGLPGLPGMCPGVCPTKKTLLPLNIGS